MNKVAFLKSFGKISRQFNKLVPSLHTNPLIFKQLKRSCGYVFHNKTTDL